jgi:hypothetical protein
MRAWQLTSRVARGSANARVPAGIQVHHSGWNQWLMSAPLLFTPLRGGSNGQIGLRRWHYNATC